MKYYFLLFIGLSYNALFSQQTTFVDFKEATALVHLDTLNKSVSGTISFQFNILKPTDSIFIDAQNMTFTNVKLDNKQVPYSNNAKKIVIKNNFEDLKNHTVSFQFKATPKKALYFVGWNTKAPNQIWTQGQGKYTSNWLPSFDDMNEKLIFNLAISFSKNYSVISNGKLKRIEKDTAKNSWFYQMEKPMSSYLVALAIGKYDKKEELSQNGIPIDMYYYPKDSLNVEPTYRYTRQMFNFLETEIGFAYPWQNYKQVPVHDFLYSGMENTGTTIFADSFVVDSIGFNDRNYITVNAHELAHQWFGNLVTETSGTHHWLQEGFATYYALLAEREIFGENHYYWQLYQYAQELFTQQKNGHATALLNPKSSSVTFYKKGAWLLHLLREKIGDKAFKQAIKNYLNTHQFQNVTSDDFINEIKKVTTKNVNAFFSKWLESPDFPNDAVMASLKQSPFIQEYLMVDCEAFSSKCKYYLSASISNEAKTKIIAQIPNRISNSIFNNNLKVRQAIAKNITKIPDSLKLNYETLLTDKSYLTQEAALYNLWVNFPKDRFKYLNQTKDNVGFNEKNVRMLWLALAISTPNYQDSNKQLYLDRLVSHTSSDYGVDVRQTAFSYLEALAVFPEDALINLINASKHFNWRFRSYAKKLIETLSESEIYATKIKRLTAAKY